MLIYFKILFSFVYGTHHANNEEMILDNFISPCHLIIDLSFLYLYDIIKVIFSFIYFLTFKGKISFKPFF